jgi:TRAP-type transport system periplasmic protein
MTRLAKLAFAAVASVVFVATPALAQKQTLKMAYWAGPSHHMVKTMEAWSKTLEAASGGNLTLEMDKASLAKPEGQYDVVKEGVRDMAWVVPSYTPGRFELYRVADIPFICSSATVCSTALWKWYEKHKLAEKEFTDTRLLMSFTTGPFALHTTKPVKTLEEVRGMKVRVAGAAVAIAKALGMSVVSMPATEAYQTLQRGTVDGTVFPWEAMDSFRLHEVVKAHLEFPGGLLTASFFININPNTLAKLTPANRDALAKAGNLAGSAFLGKAWDAADAPGRENALKRGNQIQTIAPEEFARWKPLLQAVREEWLANAKQRGVDGPALLADFEAMVKAGG